MVFLFWVLLPSPVTYPSRSLEREGGIRVLPWATEIYTQRRRFRFVHDTSLSWLAGSACLFCLCVGACVCASCCVTVTRKTPVWTYLGCAYKPTLGQKTRPHADRTRREMAFPSCAGFRATTPARRRFFGFSVSGGVSGVDDLSLFFSIAALQRTCWSRTLRPIRAAAAPDTAWLRLLSAERLWDAVQQPGNPWLPLIAAAFWSRLARQSAHSRLIFF